MVLFLVYFLSSSCATRFSSTLHSSLGMHFHGLLFGLFCAVAAGHEFTPFDELYDQGVTSYNNKEWKAAITHFEKAIASYKYYKSVLSGCYVNCSNATSGNPVINQSSLGKIALKASCVKRCLNEEFGSFTFIGRIPSYVKEDLETLMPYQYLQFVYFQEGMLAQSVSAAHTYNLRFPEDELMKGNMKFFRESGDVTEDMFVNMEPKPHLVQYNQAVEAYLKEDYAIAVDFFEKALEEYYTAVANCHGFCEGEEASQEEQWELDFYKQNAYHYIKVLECSLRCVQELSSEVHGQLFPNILPLHYHYLQFSYYQNKNYKAAAECAKSYLIFHPNDSVMEKNLESISDNIDISILQPREEAVQHNKRQTLEALMLEYSYQNFGIKDVNKSLLKPFGVVDTTQNETEEIAESRDDGEKLEDSEGNQQTAEFEDAPYESMTEKTDDIIDKKGIEVERKMAAAEKKARDELQYAEPENDVDISNLVSETSSRGYRVVDSKYMVRLDDKAEEDPIAEGPIIFEGAVLAANSTQLKGRERFAIDGLATEKECNELIDLEVSFGKPGDGYNGKVSPHTKHEKFEGIALLRAANMAKQGLVPLSTAVLYYELSERSRAQVQAYFKLPHLYFDYTHLVCRTANSDSPTDRNDLSHPVHADNCLLKENGDCVKENPALAWRDYSAIVYLNGDFEGGEFLFADSTARRVRTLVRPKCGRMVSFGGGAESFHGVKPVLGGRRCAVALWFTLSKERAEQNRIEAKLVLEELSSRQKDEL